MTAKKPASTPRKPINGNELALDLVKRGICGPWILDPRPAFTGGQRMTERSDDNR